MENQPQSTGIAQQREWTRVIVLIAKASGHDAAVAAPDTALPLSDALRAEFERRDWFAVAVNDPCMAMAELALREKAQNARAAWGLQRMEGLALVIAEPSSWPAAMIRELCAAVRRWMPAANLWSASAGRIEPLAIDAAQSSASNADALGRRVFDLDAIVAALPRDAAPPNGSAPTTSHPPVSRAAAESNPAEQGRLTRDEINMLLRSDADQDEAGVRSPETDS